jgi:two-component system, NarL family, response regulator
MTIRVMTVDDHPIVRVGIAALLANEPDMPLVAEAGDGHEAIAAYAEMRPDVVLMDLRMPHLDGVGATEAIIAADGEARIVALTSYDGDGDIHRALDAGACAYLLKDMLGTEMIGTIRRVAAGERVIPLAVAGRLAEFLPRVELTGREVEVLRLAAKGLKNRDIARALSRGEETVKAHLKHIMAKLGVADRTEAVTAALQRGIIHLDG